MEDEEFEKIKKKQLEDLLKQQNINNVLNEMPVMELTSQNFNQEINNNSLLLVDFWAEWCGPCKMIGPSLEELSEEYGEKVKIVKVNVDENPNSPSQLGVRGIPALFLFKDGAVVSNKTGAAPKAALKDWIDSSI